MLSKQEMAFLSRSFAVCLKVQNFRAISREGGGDLIFFMFCIENQGALKEYIAQPVDGDLEPKCLSLVVAPATLSGLGQTWGRSDHR